MIIKIDISGKVEEISLPSSWAEVSSKLWRDILLLRAACEVKILPKEKWENPLVEEKELILRDFLLAKRALSRIFPKYERIFSPEVVQMIVQESLWLSELPNHYMSFRHRLYLIWRGPKDKLTDWTWLRYSLAEECFRAYVYALESEDDALRKKSCNELFACLYGVFGFWNSRLADLYIHLAKLVPMRQKLECIENFRGMREWLQGVYRPAFTGGSAESSEDLMRTLTIAMAGNKFGTVYQVKEANLHDVLIYQCQLIEEQSQR